jgi:hypothetical protein
MDQLIPGLAALVEAFRDVFHPQVIGFGLNWVVLGMATALIDFMSSRSALGTVGFERLGTEGRGVDRQFARRPARNVF